MVKNKRSKTAHENKLEIAECDGCGAIQERLEKEGGKGLQLKDLAICAHLSKRVTLRHLKALMEFEYIRRRKPRKKIAIYNLPPSHRYAKKKEMIDTYRGPIEAKGPASEREKFDDIAFITKAIRYYSWCRVLHPRKKGPSVSWYGNVLYFGPPLESIQIGETPNEDLPFYFPKIQYIAERARCKVIFVSNECIPQNAHRKKKHEK